MPEAKTSYTTILGAAAEHYVMCQLLRRNRIAALAPAGVPFADILVSDHLGSALSAVQVKARTVGADGGWHMSSKHEKLVQAFYLYCFVDFGPDLNNQHRCWIVPSGIVAKVLIQNYQAWLHKPGKGGKPHKIMTCVACGRITVTSTCKGTVLIGSSLMKMPGTWSQPLRQQRSEKLRTNTNRRKS